MKSQLLCTFTTKENIDDVVKQITDSYKIIFDKVYVLQNENDIFGSLLGEIETNTTGRKIIDKIYGE